MGEPQTVEMKVVDVVPYKYGVYCCIEDGKPFVNEIVGRDWSEDGEKVILMLETHNFLFHLPGDSVQVVPIERRPGNMSDGDCADFMAKRPKPQKVCEACGGKGKIEMERPK